MSLGIRLNVDSSEVKIARQDIQGLSVDMKDLDRVKDINLGVDNMDQAGQVLSELSKSITQLKNIASSGQKSGGMLRVDQFQQAAKLSKAIKEDFESYRTILSQAENRLEGLVSKRAALKKAQEGEYRQSVRKERDKEISQVGREIERLTKALDKANFRAERMERTSSESANAIEGFGTIGAGRASLKKAFGAGVALMGGFSALRFASDSLAKTVSFDETEAALMMRGAGRRSRTGAYRFTALQGLEMANSLNISTGAGGADLDRELVLAQLFARGRGISGVESAGYLGGLYQSTRMGPERFEKHLKQITKAIEENGVGGLTRTYLQQNTQFLAMLSETRGGAPLSEGEVSRANALQASLWSMGVMGQGESGSNLLNILHHTLTRGGSGPLSRMFHFNALGGASNIEEYIKLIEQREQGLTGMAVVGGKKMTNLEAYIEHARRRFGTREDGSLSAAGRLFLKQDTGLPMATVNRVVDELAPGFSAAQLKEFMAGEGDKDLLGKGFERYAGTRGAQTAGIVKEVEDLKLALGDELIPVVNETKGSIASLGKVAARSVARMAQAPGNVSDMVDAATTGQGLPGKVPVGIFGKVSPPEGDDVGSQVVRGLLWLQERMNQNVRGRFVVDLGPDAKERGFLLREEEDLGSDE